MTRYESFNVIKVKQPTGRYFTFTPPTIGLIPLDTLRPYRTLSEVARVIGNHMKEGEYIVSFPRNRGIYFKRESTGNKAHVSWRKNDFSLSREEFERLAKELTKVLAGK